MIRYIAGSIATVALGTLVFSAVGLGNNKPPAPPGQDPCSHGRTDKACRPDPQPTHGKDCEHHGKNGGVNEDHCKQATQTTTTETTSTTNTTTTQTTTQRSTTETQTTSEGNTTSVSMPQAQKPKSKPVIPGTKLHKCPTGTHRTNSGCARKFHGHNHPVITGSG